MMARILAAALLSALIALPAASVWRELLAAIDARRAQLDHVRRRDRPPPQQYQLRAAVAGLNQSCTIQSSWIGYRKGTEMSKTALKVVRTESEPAIELDTAPAKRAYLTEDEAERLVRAANERDRCMILMAYTRC